VDCSDPFYRRRKQESVDALRGGPVEPVDSPVWFKYFIVLRAKRQNFVETVFVDRKDLNNLHTAGWSIPFLFRLLSQSYVIGIP